MNCLCARCSGVIWSSIRELGPLRFCSWLSMALSGTPAFFRASKMALEICDPFLVRARSVGCPGREANRYCGDIGRRGGCIGGGNGDGAIVFVHLNRLRASGGQEDQSGCPQENAARFIAGFLSRDCTRGLWRRVDLDRGRSCTALRALSVRLYATLDFGSEAADLASNPA